MAPLYKRYVPPKAVPTTQTTGEAPPPPPVRPTKPAPKPTQHEEPQKRKRERTDEEVAERKVKKLRKKGIDPATVELSAKVVPAQKGSDATLENSKDNAENGVKAPASGGPAVPSQGEFAHIKDKKKRHRLEKEARNARIAAEKQVKAGSLRVDASDEEGQTADDGHEVHDIGDAQQLIVEEPLDNAHSVESEAPTPTKRKKRRNDLDDNEALTEAAATSREGTTKSEAVEEDLQRPEEQKYDERLSQPKKRRHRLEAVLEKSDTGARNEETHGNENEHLKKHGSVIGKFQKSQQAGKDAPTNVEDEDNPEAPQPILRDLVPLPLPEKAPTPEFVPDPNALPPWLAKPMVVADDQKSTFAELGVDTRLSNHLSKLGFSDALPVQQALIPLLLQPGSPGARYLPGTESVLPDIAVGAPTGSGKTIAYLMPMIEGMKQLADAGRLRALVVVPTRELVMQVAAVAESLAKASKVKIGVATGTGSFGDEQARLIQRGRKHEPERRQALMARAKRLQYPPPECANDEDAHASDQFEDYLDEIESLDAKQEQLLADVVSELEGHVPTYESACDILVATPGRLLEHLDNTLGFSLAHLEWLVLDEADKLLDGQYSNFLQVITAELERPHSEEEQDARERYLRAEGKWNDSLEKRVRKVVLSATMTRDISKLMELKLKRPQMVLVRGKDATGQENAGEQGDADASFELPPTLQEHSVHVGDGSEKPLFLLQVLNDHIMTTANAGKTFGKHKSTLDFEDSDTDSSSDSDEDSTSSEASSNTSSRRKNRQSRSTGVDEADVNELANADDASIHPSRLAAIEQSAPAPTVLIFTSSTESASRLSHLLSTLTQGARSSSDSINLIPSNILTLTSTTTSKHLSKSLSGIAPTDPVLAITTDRAARGLDALGSRMITHVVQYDVPRSATNYVHRVGRTARAGRWGEAWTLFTHTEARWFVNEVVRGKGVRRIGGPGVEKIKVRLEDEEVRERFRRAIEGLKEDVLSSGKGKRGKK